jgi:hypothetical protein
MLLKDREQNNRKFSSTSGPVVRLCIFVEIILYSASKIVELDVEDSIRPLRSKSGFCSIKISGVKILVCLITSRCIRYLLKDLSVPHQVPSTMFVVHIKSVEIRA